MSDKQINCINIKRHIKMIIAVVCVVCFIAVFIVSAIHFSDHSSSTAQAFGPCQRTLMPECLCETGVAQQRMLFQSHTHNESHVDCFVCVIVSKTVDQIRYFSAAAADFLIYDLSILILIGLFFILTLTGIPTPVKLKNRTNN